MQIQTSGRFDPKKAPLDIALASLIAIFIIEEVVKVVFTPP
jgi:hypothetical protein